MLSKKTVIVTVELLEAGKSPRGGFTSAQLQCLGVQWVRRAPAGWWIPEVLGNKITPEAAKQFIALRGQCKDKKSRWKNVAKELRLDLPRKRLVEALAERIQWRIAQWPKRVLLQLSEDDEFLEEIEQCARRQIAQTKRSKLVPTNGVSRMRA